MYKRKIKTRRQTKGKVKGESRYLTVKQRRLPKGLKAKIIASKKRRGK
jgi:hypothetical protein